MSINFIKKGGGKTVLPDGTKFANSTFTAFDLENFDTSDMTTFELMFKECAQLATFDFKKANLQKIVNMGNMFQGCTNLTSVNLNDINIANSININGMFRSCSNLTSLDLSCFNSCIITGIGGIFNGCNSLVNVDIGDFIIQSTALSPYSSIVTGCTNLSNKSMNSIMKAISNGSQPSSSSWKTLQACGFTQAQAEICTTLSNWEALEDLGWTTGY